MQKRDHVMVARPDTRRKPDEGIWETVKVIIQALLIAFFVRTFLYQPFNIPSASMYPTLKIGDYLFVSKLSYGYGKYSFNFSLGAFGHELKCCSFVDFPGRIIFQSTPQRGDIAVFKLPTNTDVDYIKRVIGLPGDHIQMKDDELYINGQQVKRERVEDFVDSDSGRGGPVAQYLETLPGGVEHRVLDFSPNEEMDTTQEYVVPPNHYFMMGDNRDNSQDSRYLSVVGYVPIENFVGRADIIFFSISPQARLWEVWMWPFEIRWSRFFNIL